MKKELIIRKNVKRYLYHQVIYWLIYEDKKQV